MEDVGDSFEANATQLMIPNVLDEDNEGVIVCEGDVGRCATNRAFDDHGTGSSNASLPIRLSRWRMYELMRFHF